MNALLPITPATLTVAERDTLRLFAENEKAASTQWRDPLPALERQRERLAWRGPKARHHDGLDVLRTARPTTALPHLRSQRRTHHLMQLTGRGQLRDTTIETVLSHQAVIEWVGRRAAAGE